MGKNKTKTEYAKKISKESLFLVAFVCIYSFGVKVSLAAEITPVSVIELVNEARTREGVQVLRENENLTKAAQEKANDMISNNYFAHTSPSGLTPWYWIEKNGYDYKYAGENLAINFSDPIEQQEAWMNSPTHKKNILNPKYVEIGVAVAAGKINGQNSIITVQEFGKLISDKSVPVASIQKVNNQEDQKILAVTSVKDDVPISFSGSNLVLIFWSMGAISLISLLTYEVANILRRKRLAREIVFARNIK